MAATLHGCDPLHNGGVILVSALLCGWNQNDPGRLTLSVSSHMLPRQLLTANC
jgi:hypothetical protein